VKTKKSRIFEAWNLYVSASGLRPAKAKGL
jgi:hypothetical protein